MGWGVRWPDKWPFGSSAKGSSLERLAEARSSKAPAATARTSDLDARALWQRTESVVKRGTEKSHDKQT